MKLQPPTADIGVCPKNPHINTDLLILCGHPLPLIPKRLSLLFYYEQKMLLRHSLISIFSIVKMIKQK